MNALGYLRVMFTVDDIDDTLERLRKRGAQLVGEVVQYEDAYRLCYIRGPEGLLIGLAPGTLAETPRIAASQRVSPARQRLARASCPPPVFIEPSKSGTLVAS